MKELLLILALILFGFSNLDAQYKRVYVKFDGEKNDIAIRNEIRVAYLANPFHAWSAGDIQLNWQRYSNYVNSVKTNTHLSLVAWNPATQQKEGFDDEKALETLAIRYIPWGMKWFQKADLAGSENDDVRSWRISHRWAHSWKYWRRNKMYVPKSMVVFE